MGAGHHHGPPADLQLSRLARRASLSLLVLVAIVTVVGVVLLWPGERSRAQAPGLAASVADVVAGRVVGVEPCPATMDAAPAGSIHHACRIASVELLAGERAGETVPVELIGVSAVSGLVTGDTVRVTEVGEPGAEGTFALLVSVSPAEWWALEEGVS